jgi:hypothetical protein
MARDYVLSESAWQAFKRDHDQLRLQVASLNNRLSTYGLRRHEAEGYRDPIWLGKADSDIAGGADGTVSIWAGEPGSEEDTTKNKENCYNRSTTTINSGDWCLVREIRAKRYVIPLPGPATRNVVMWAGNSVLEGPAAGRWATDDFGYVKFLGRYGNADAGITFDSSETTPSTNGNMEVTQDGMYLFHLLMDFETYGPDWSTGGTGYADGKFSLRYKRGVSAFANTGIAASDWVAEPYIGSNTNYSAAASGLFPLLDGDLLHIRLEGSTWSAGDPKGFELSGFRMTYERVGEYVDSVTP